MSIDMNKTDTPLEKIDVIANLIEQMYLANMTRDVSNFKKAHNKASKLAFDLARQLEKDET